MKSRISYPTHPHHSLPHPQHSLQELFSVIDFWTCVVHKQLELDWYFFWYNDYLLLFIRQHNIPLVQIRIKNIVHTASTCPYHKHVHTANNQALWHRASHDRLVRLVQNVLDQTSSVKQRNIWSPQSAHHRQYERLINYVGTSSKNAALCCSLSSSSLAFEHPRSTCAEKIHRSKSCWSTLEVFRAGLLQLPCK